MSDIANIRDALIWNQTEAMRVIMDLQERVRDLELERDALNHTVKCKQAEITARAASMQRLRDLLVDAEIELQAARYQGRPAQDRLNEDGEPTYAPNIVEEEYDEDDKD